MKEKGFILEGDYTEILIEAYNPGEISKSRVLEIEPVMQSALELLFEEGILIAVMPPDGLNTYIGMARATEVKELSGELSEGEHQTLKAMEELDIRVSDLVHWYNVEYPLRVK